MASVAGSVIHPVGVGVGVSEVEVVEELVEAGTGITVTLARIVLVPDEVEGMALELTVLGPVEVGGMTVELIALSVPDEEEDVALELLLVVPSGLELNGGAGAASRVKLKKSIGDSKRSVRIRPLRSRFEMLSYRRTGSVRLQNLDTTAFRAGTSRVFAAPFTSGGKFFATHAPQLMREEFQLLMISGCPL